MSEKKFVVQPASLFSCVTDLYHTSQIIQEKFAREPWFGEISEMASAELKPIRDLLIRSMNALGDVAQGKVPLQGTDTVGRLNDAYFTCDMAIKLWRAIRWPSKFEKKRDLAVPKVRFEALLHAYHDSVGFVWKLYDSITVIL